VKNEFKFLLFQQFVQHRHRNLGRNSNYAIVKTKVLGPKQSMQGAFVRTNLQKGMTNIIKTELKFRAVLTFSYCEL
jgi:hypothetical protein